ncbi:hypothetical protein ACQV2T_04320 [Facklamia sp. P13069]|uniref:hypothetical protein n=1 Tax=Facklamia sp. P13069 TaxID=3421954 RepID=UPI003D179AC6
MKNTKIKIALISIAIGVALKLVRKKKYTTKLYLTKDEIVTHNGNGLLVVPFKTKI